MNKLISACMIAVTLALNAPVQAKKKPELTHAQILNAIGMRFANKPFSEMMAYYGAPKRQIELSGETVYTWEMDDDLDFGSQGPLHVHCQMDAYVTAAAVVRTVGLTGQFGACRIWMPTQ